MKRRPDRLLWLAALIFLNLPRLLQSQQTRKSDSPVTDPPRVLAASSITGAAPVIDGRLDDSAWLTASLASDFIQREPVTGAPASQRTTVSVVYDDGAIYVAMRMFDTEPHLIEMPLS